jgi:pimeloyl-ACP methyl ester carboxylesterase
VGGRERVGLIRPFDVPANGLRFRGHTAGDDGRELVLLLHGFPQPAASWNDQIAALADGGYRAVAPDQRGYSPGARPGEVRQYAMDHLVADAMAIADAFDAPRFHLVGHDWGGAVGWAAAAAHPERVASLTVVSTPHPRALAGALFSSLQGLRSLYAGFFQVPRVPELLLSARQYGVLRQLLERPGLPPASAEEAVAAMAEPGALTAALNWYRAAGRGGLGRTEAVTVPTLYVWSSADAALGRQAAESTARFVTGPYRFEVLEGVSHWVLDERPAELNRMLLDHVRSHPAAAA